VPVGQYELQPLFAEPIFRVSIADAITPAAVAFVKGLKMVRNDTNLISENTYIFKEPELAGMAKAVQEVLDFYAKEVLAIPQRLYVTQSWSLLNEPNVGMHAHSHSNSIVSGSLYFCDLPDPPSRMIFTRHKCYRQLDLQPTAGARSIYNTPSNTITPRKHDVLLFSSELTHMVEPNASTQPRYSIAFNTFIKGKLGGYRNISELELV
jgi:uncharacterized protein (TIGR02466 family)